MFSLFPPQPEIKFKKVSLNKLTIRQVWYYWWEEFGDVAAR